VAQRQTGRRRVYRARVKLDGDNKVRDIALKVSDRQVAQQKLNESCANWKRGGGADPSKAEREAAQSHCLTWWGVCERTDGAGPFGRSPAHLDSGCEAGAECRDKLAM